MTDMILFGVFPYVAVALMIGVGIYRYFVDRYSWSSQSSQFLESRVLFWGSIPWHYAILIILLAHFLAFLVPSGWAVLLGKPLRLYILEVTGLALGISTLIAVALLIFRRITKCAGRSSHHGDRLAGSGDAFAAGCDWRLYRLHFALGLGLVPAHGNTLALVADQTRSTDSLPRRTAVCGQTPRLQCFSDSGAVPVLEAGPCRQCPLDLFSASLSGCDLVSAASGGLILFYFYDHDSMRRPDVRSCYRKVT